MSKYEDTVMTAIKELEEKLDYAMEVDDEPVPKPKNPSKKPGGSWYSYSPWAKS